MGGRQIPETDGVSGLGGRWSFTFTFRFTWGERFVISELEKGPKGRKKKSYVALSGLTVVALVSRASPFVELWSPRWGVESGREDFVTVKVNVKAGKRLWATGCRLLGSLLAV